MDTITTLINLFASVLTSATSWAILDEHPSSLFPTRAAYKRARKVVNRELTARDLGTIGAQPTVGAWVSSLILLGIFSDADTASLTSVRDRLVDERYGFALTTEEVAHAPVLNEQAQRVARGEVKRDVRGRIMSREVAEIFA